MFDSLDIPDARPILILKRAMAAFVSLCVPIALCSGYRAYYQVRSLELRVSAAASGAESIVETHVVTSGRTDVDLKLELVQGAHTAMLAKQRVPGNEWASIDPRSPRASQQVVVRAEVLTGFHDGEAVVRATATGRPQWLRLPPPTVREAGVRIGAGLWPAGAKVIARMRVPPDADN